MKLVHRSHGLVDNTFGAVDMREPDLERRSKDGWSVIKGIEVHDMLRWV